MFVFRALCRLVLTVCAVSLVPLSAVASPGRPMQQPFAPAADEAASAPAFELLTPSDPITKYGYVAPVSIQIQIDATSDIDVFEVTITHLASGTTVLRETIVRGPENDNIYSDGGDPTTERYNTFHVWDRDLDGDNTLSVRAIDTSGASSEITRTLVNCGLYPAVFCSN